LKKLFKLGWPISLQINGEMLSFLVSTTFIGWLGTVSLAASQVTMQYRFLIMVPIFSISQAAGILVGQAYGAKQFSEIKHLGSASLVMTSIVMVVIGAIFIFFPRMLASLYFDVNSPQNSAVLHLVILVFIIFAFSQFFDAIRNVLTGSLRGLLDTKFPMINGLLCIWLVSVPMGYLFAFLFHWGIVGVTLGWTSGMLLGMIVLYARWQKMHLKFSEGATHLITL